MTRIDDETLAFHLEVALATTAPPVLDRLGDPDRQRRSAAIGEIARQLVERLRCFDIRTEQRDRLMSLHPTLFPSDMEPLG